MKKDKYKEIIKNLISVGIEFKMHKNYPVIYCKQKIDPQILEIAKNNREGIARQLIKEKQELIKSYNASSGTHKFFYEEHLSKLFLIYTF